MNTASTTTSPHDNGHGDRGSRRTERKRIEAIEYLNAPPDHFAARDARAHNQRIARHVSHLERQVPRATRRDCSALAHAIIDGELSRPEAVAVLRAKWEGGNVTTYARSAGGGE